MFKSQMQSGMEQYSKGDDVEGSDPPFEMKTWTWFEFVTDSVCGAIYDDPKRQKFGMKKRIGALHEMLKKESLQRRFGHPTRCEGNPMLKPYKI